MEIANPFWPPPDPFAHAREHARPDCPKCRGTGTWKYDHNHSTICDLCCRHDRGWWKLEQHYGPDNGKWCCRAGCGKKLDAPPTEAVAADLQNQGLE